MIVFLSSTLAQSLRPADRGWQFPTVVKPNVDEGVGLLPQPRNDIVQGPKHYAPSFGSEVPIDGLTNPRRKQKKQEAQPMLYI